MASDSIQAPPSAAWRHTVALIDRLFPPPRSFAVRLWDGTRLPAVAPAFTLVLNYPGALRRMFAPPIERALGEAFISGDFEIDGDIFAAVALFTYLRGLHAHAAAGGVAASTGTSATAMLACCAHHLADILPIVGLSGAAIFLNAYKTPLLWLGILMNLIGIVYLLRKVRQQPQMACHAPIAPRSVAS